MIDPVKFKKILFQLLKLLIVIELVSAFSEGLGQHQWGRLGFDLIVAGVLYVMWERIALVVREKKEQTKKRIEKAPQEIKLRDALIFSLLWSDEIYSEIPPDRRRLVVISYTLITLGLVAAFVKIGTGLMPLVVSGALVLAAVNLVIWVVSVERGERESLRTELQLAHDVQASLMPTTNPTMEGYDIAGMSVPAREVGGDLFDFTCLGSNAQRFGISVVDVSGKGMQAAMAAVFTSGALASNAKMSDSPAEILTGLNNAVYSHSRRGHFVAFLLAMLDLKSKGLTFANAGQTKPLLRSDGQLQWLDSVGVHFPLGMKEDSAYEERTVQLQSGDILFLLTDGFTDAMNGQKEVYGYERIEQALKKPELSALSAQQIMEYVTLEVKGFVHETPQFDDMTMVVVKVL